MGVEPRRVLSDNGACYRSGAHADACRRLGLRHSFTRPYRPRTNGKAERFIKTLTNRWAYGAIYGSSVERERALPGWLTHYNYTRRHGALSHKPPAARLNELNNLAGAISDRSGPSRGRPRAAPRSVQSLTRGRPWGSPRRARRRRSPPSPRRSRRRAGARRQRVERVAVRVGRDRAAGRRRGPRAAGRRSPGRRSCWCR